MNSVTIELSDDLANEIDRVVDAGEFRAREDLIHRATQEFLGVRRRQLLERQQLDEIEWALSAAEQ